MFILNDYSFLKDKVEGGRVEDSAPFDNGGLALADKPNNPNFVYVFFFYKRYIWWAYAWANKINKSFLKFHNEVLENLKVYNLPIIGTHKGYVFKNHTQKIGTFGKSKLYIYRGLKWGA